MVKAENKKQGICCTCNHIEDCLHKLSNGQVIWFCEQFDDYIPQKPLNHALTNSFFMLDKQNDYMGLCVNCENKQTCIHSKTQGGIWHCEEYL